LKNVGIGKAFMFPSLAGKGSSGKHGLSGRFAAIMERAGVAGKRMQASGLRTPSSLSFHSLRGTASPDFDPQTVVKICLSWNDSADKSRSHEMCSSVRGRFPCNCTGQFWRFASTLSGQANAAI
jgi:hypothetical protein